MTFKGTVTLASGSLIAQAITLGCTPILTRLFSPESFGILGTYNSLSTLLIPMITWSLPVALPLANCNVNVENATKACLLVILATSSMYLLVAIFWGANLGALAGIQETWLIPTAIIGAASAGIIQVFQNLGVRDRHFRSYAAATALQSLYSNGLKIALSFISAGSWVLPISQILGGALGIFPLQKAVHLKIKSLISPTPWKAISKVVADHSDIVLLRTPQTMISALSFGLPALLLLSEYGAITAGFFTLATTILSAPGNLIGKAFSDSTLPQLVSNHKANLPLLPILLKQTGIIALLASMPYLIIVCLGEIIFSTAFGPNWQQAGEYASFLAPLYLLNVANRVCVAAIPILGIESSLLKWEIASTAARIGTLILIIQSHGSASTAILAYSFSGSSMYLILFSVIFSKARRHDIARNTGH